MKNIWVCLSQWKNICIGRGIEMDGNGNGNGNGNRDERWMMKSYAKDFIHTKERENGEDGVEDEYYIIL